MLTTTLGPSPAGCRASHVALVVALVCGQSCHFRVSHRVTRHVPNRADVRVERPSKKNECGFELLVAQGLPVTIYLLFFYAFAIANHHRIDFNW